jgi:DNA-directed RNA polymerase specialized sigma24 family protein
MAPRDQRPQLRAKAVRARDTWDRTEKAARNAHKAYRVALMKASDGGVPKADLARATGSSDSRIRQLVNQARAEAS